MIFAHYPAVAGASYLSNIAYCAYNQDKEKFWKLNDYLFASDKTNLQDHGFIAQALEKFGFNPNEITARADSDETKAAVAEQLKEIKKTGVYGTPSAFINGRVFVGPKPYRVYKSAIKKIYFILIYFMQKSEIRKDYLSNKCVIITPSRSKRPRDIKEETIISRAAHCQFCPDKINHKNILDRIKAPEGEILSIKNIFPAVTLDNKKAYGRQEVVIETPDHKKELHDLSRRTN